MVICTPFRVIPASRGVRMEKPAALICTVTSSCFPSLEIKCAPFLDIHLYCMLCVEVFSLRRFLKYCVLKTKLPTARFTGVSCCYAGSGCPPNLRESETGLIRIGENRNFPEIYFFPEFRQYFSLFGLDLVH